MATMNKERLASILAKARADKEADKQETGACAPIPKLPEQSKQLTDKKPTSAPIPISQMQALRAKMALRAREKEDKTLVPASQLMTYAADSRNYSSAQTQLLIEKAKEPLVTKELLSMPIEPDIIQHIDMHGKLISYNFKQQEFVQLASSGSSCVLIGAAGTGKTTCMQGTLLALIQSGRIPKLDTDGHKYLTDGTPGCVIIAYTRRATNNIRKVLSEDLKANAITSHKLLEYAPEFFEVIDENGDSKKSMRFIESRNAENPLPSSIATIVVEEASMLSVELFTKISIALSHKIQWIFLGDLNQLPPVFGSAILGFKLLELPVVELTEVYRQALESPIIRLAHRIISGKPIPVKEFDAWKYEGQLTLHHWKKAISGDDAVRTLAEFFKKAYDQGVYNIDEDIILIPYNKACGSIELNNHIANHIARKTQRTTYEVIAGFNKHYYSVGDKVLYDKEDAEIVEIATNMSYTGARFQAESKHLDYWGHNPQAVAEFQANKEAGLSSQEDVDIDFLLDSVSSTDSDDRVRKASHIITLLLTDTGATISIDSAAEVNNLIHAYALTVHKAQGSEWRKVYFCLHQSHATMLQRELLYTGVTRAREELYVICEPDSFVKGIDRQRIKGNTLEEKAEFFKGKLDSNTTAAINGG